MGANNPHVMNSCRDLGTSNNLTRQFTLQNNKENNFRNVFDIRNFRDQTVTPRYCFFLHEGPVISLHPMFVVQLYIKLPVPERLVVFMILLDA